MSHKIFAGLKEYTSVFTDSKDPLPVWASREWFPDIPRLLSHRASSIPAEQASDTMMTNWPMIRDLRAGYLTKQYVIPLYKNLHDASSYLGSSRS